MLSEFDVSVLEILSEDARTATERIAVMTGRGEDEVKA